MVITEWEYSIKNSDTNEKGGDFIEKKNVINCIIMLFVLGFWRLW